MPENREATLRLHTLSQPLDGAEDEKNATARATFPRTTGENSEHIAPADRAGMPLDVGGKDQACSQGEEGPQDGAAPSNGLELRPQAEGAGRLLRLR